jgi:hypothetical protein
MKFSFPWDLLSVLLLGSTMCMCLTVSWLFVDPNNVLNPFPPPTDVFIITPVPAPSNTPTSAFPTFPPEWTATPEGWTPSATPEVTNTETINPSETPASMTDTPGSETLTPTITLTLSGTPPSPTPSRIGPPPSTTPPGGYP